MPKLKSYHFDCGNSNAGPVGFCARVTATSKAKALAKLAAVLDEAEIIADEDDIEYLTVYFNPDYVTVKDIDEVDDE